MNDSRSGKAEGLDESPVRARREKTLDEKLSPPLQI
jgi:hypothetical protein